MERIIGNIRKGDKIRLKCDPMKMMYGHEKYAGHVVTINGFRENGKSVYIQEFIDDPNVSLDWAPSGFIEEILYRSYVPEHLFQIE